MMSLLFHPPFMPTFMTNQNLKYYNHGIYAELIAKYIAHKRALGYKMINGEVRFAPFDRLTIERGETTIGITKELCDAYMERRPMETDVSRYGRISSLRDFSSFLQMMGYESYLPTLPKFRSIFTPHIYTKKEMTAIFRECDKLHVHQQYPYSIKCMMPALIRTLYGTGIRIGEALRLKNADVNLQDGLILVRESKNGQDRLLPMSLSLREVCKDYAAYKLKCGLDLSPDNPFFTTPDGRSTRPATVMNNFRTILFRAGIPYEGRHHGPRVHDLRHTFCVNALVQMSENGQDLYYTMPILMAYMGHKKIETTNRYVRLTEEMYPGLLKQMDAAQLYVFPEMGNHNEEDDYEDN